MSDDSSSSSSSAPSASRPSTSEGGGADLPVVVIGGMVITPDSYNHFAHHREIGDRLMAEYGFSKEDVTEARISEGRIEIDWIHCGPRDEQGRRHVLDPTIRTTIITPAGIRVVTGGALDADTPT